MATFRLQLLVRRAKQKANLMYKYVNNLAPVCFFNMFTPRTLSFDVRDARQKKLPKPNQTSVTAELLYGMIFQRNFAAQNLLKSSREALINGSLQ